MKIIFPSFTLSIWITWGGLVLSPVELQKTQHTPSTTRSDYSIHKGPLTLIILRLFAPVSKWESSKLSPVVVLHELEKQGSKRVCLVLSQHFCCSSSPRQPWQDIVGPLLFSPPFCYTIIPPNPAHTPSPFSTPAHPILSAGQRVETPGGKELSGSLSTVLLPLLRLQSSDVRRGDWK